MCEERFNTILWTTLRCKVKLSYWIKDSSHFLQQKRSLSFSVLCRKLRPDSSDNDNPFYWACLLGKCTFLKSFFKAVIEKLGFPHSGQSQLLSTSSTTSFSVGFSFKFSKLTVLSVPAAASSIFLTRPTESRLTLFVSNTLVNYKSLDSFEKLSQISQIIRFTPEWVSFMWQMSWVLLINNSPHLQLQQLGCPPGITILKIWVIDSVSFTKPFAEYFF